MRKSNLRQRGLAALLSGALALSSFPAAMPVMAAGKDVRSITSLKTNGLVNPIGVDNKKPVFNWIMESSTRGAKQAAYQIVVKDMAGQKMWDSGKVPSGESANIVYAGTELAARTKYQWQVTVTDEKGKTWTSETNTFETSFLDTGYTSWGGAQWIGAEDKNIDASMADLFDMHMDMQLGSDTKKASVVFGANDFRLQNKAMNVWGKGGEDAENYFRYEVDLTDSTKPKLNIYVVGMPTRVKGTDSSGKETWVTQNTENDPAEPDITVDIPSTVFDNNVSGTNAPQASADKPISVRIWTPSINTVSCSLNGVEVDSKRQLNPLGGNHNSNSFPNLNSIGFAVPAGGTAEYSNIELVNSDVARETLLFSQNDGATYEIFNGLENVTVAADEDLITVKGAAETGTLVYKDPSYGSSPMVRHAFSTGGKVVKNARLYVSAQGTYEMFINGTKVSDGLFNPGNEEYSTSMPYQVYDVTRLLKTGDNAIGAQLGQGWWSGELNYTTNDYDYYGTHQALLARMDITYADATTKTIFTNPDDWKVSTSGPVRYESHYHGERYDGQIDKTYSGWSTVDYKETADWKKPVVHTPKMNKFNFVVRYDEEASIVKELNVVKALGEAKTGTGSYIYDMGENVIGVPQITIPKEYVDEGKTVTVRYAEILYPDLPEYREDGLVGSMMVENLRAALCTDFYIANDQAVQVFEPHFTFHGYRYIEISGLKKELPAENIKTEVISSVKMTATYDSSNANVNRLFKNVQNSQTSNFLSLPTDCPQRNERLGWTGDAQVFSMAASYNTDVYNFYRNWLKSLRACQRKDGSLPAYAPTAEPQEEKYTRGFQGVSWDAALTVIPYNMYMQTGNPAIISDNMAAIDTYLNYLDGGDLSSEYTHLTSHTGILADWLSVDSTDAALINNAVYVYLIGLARDMAGIIKNTDLQAKYAGQYDLAKAEWNQCYMDTNGKTKTTQSEGRGGIVTYENNTEAAYATPLRYGVVSDELIDKAVANYVQTVKDAGHTITSGFSGTPNLVPVLTQYGYIEDAYKLFEQTKYASWLYPVTQGATSVWERWNSYTVEGGFNGNNSMNSFNHFSLGAISEWMMSYQLGITRDAGKAGYKEFVLQPVAGGSFTYAKGSYESNYGTIYSGWTAEDGKMTSYEATVPANTTATLYLPVTEAQASALKAPEGASFVGMEARNGMECAKYTLESGEYNFQISMAKEITDLKDQVGNLQDQADELQKKADELQKKADDLQKAAEQAEAKAKTDASARADAEAKAQAAEKARAEAETARKAAEDAAAKAKAAQTKAETSLAKNQFKAKKASLKTVKSSKKKTAAVTWKKVSGASGYQIQYSTKSNFKGAKKVTIKKGSTTKTTIKKLKSGKKYYFRIRAYKKIGGSNQYTSYSAKKSVKIK